METRPQMVVTMKRAVVGIGVLVAVVLGGAPHHGQERSGWEPKRSAQEADLGVRQVPHRRGHSLVEFIRASRKQTGDSSARLRL